MATQAQILANRRNAQHSTGPRSVEGKAVSRFNALKTGIAAKSQVIPGEDPAELDQLAAGYHLQFQPATPLERFLVDTLVHAEWQLRRLHQIEAKFWIQVGTPESGEAFESHLQAFARLNRRIDAAERSYYRALHELQSLRSQPDAVMESEFAALLQCESLPLPPAAALVATAAGGPPVARSENLALRL
jgi:hypothetical protein